MILVSSALHLPRARAWFQKAGVRTIYCAPSDYLVYRGLPYTWKAYIPSISQVRKWDILIKEKLGSLEVQFKS